MIFSKPRKGKLNKYLAFAASIYLVALAAAVYGGSIVYFKIWPYSILQQIGEYVRGDLREHTSLAEKVVSDLDIVPARHLKKYDWTANTFAEYRPLKALPIRSRRADPLLFLSPDAPDGLRAVMGVLDLEEGLHGMILLDEHGRPMNTWVFSQEDLDWKSPPDNVVDVYQFILLRDGSVVVTFQTGESMVRYDWCGREMWRIPGKFHHSVETPDGRTVWALGGQGLDRTDAEVITKVDIADGRILKKINMTDIMRSNPDIDIFDYRRIKIRKNQTLLGDPWHPNDADPLPANLSSHYENFEAGDVVVSFATTNLVFVFDPDTLKVKWWRKGLTASQHDPDWNTDGTLTIFDNNDGRNISRIMEIDPATYSHRILFDGKKHNFYSHSAGNHERTEGGGIIITSSNQGRVLEVDSGGSLVFEFLNRYDENSRNLALYEADFYPMGYFEELPLCD